MSEAVNEFVMSRCIEILEQDVEHTTLCHEISALEEELRAIATDEQLKIINKIDSAKEKLFCTDAPKLYRNGFNDRLREF